MKNLFSSIVATLKRADDWLINRKLRLPKFQEDIGWIKPILPWVVRAIIYIPLGILASWIIYWLLWIGPRTYLSHYSQRLAIPTIQPTATSRLIGNRWDNHSWLSHEDARALRSQVDVINLAYLKSDGSAQFSTGYSASIEEQAWVKFHRPSFPQLTHSSTTSTQVIVDISGQRFNLNIFQPFTHQDHPQQILIIDSTGQVWQADIELVGLTNLEVAKANLTISIPPNPNLSFTY